MNDVSLSVISLTLVSLTWPEFTLQELYITAPNKAQADLPS